MDKKKPWDERLLGTTISMFFFGLVVTILDLTGVDLNWETGVNIMILSLVGGMLIFIIGVISTVIYAARLRRKSNE